MATAGRGNTPTMATTTTAAFFALGNELMNRRRQAAARTEMARCRSTFGTSPQICAMLWSQISLAMEPTNGAKPVHLLWGSMSMKLHCSESVLLSLAGGVHEQTFRKWSWHFVDEMANLQHNIIPWDNRFRHDSGNVCLVSVDGTEFEICQLAPFWTG